MFVVDVFSVSAIIIAYLIGSISCAILVCKFAGLPDPRTEGSKNAGATNVLRIGGKKLALLTLFGDILKGIIAVMIGRILGLDGFVLGLVGLAVFLGHLYPLYFGFKGGKGVATLIGILVVLSPWLAIFFGIVWLIVASIYKYSSLSSLVAVSLSPFFALLLHRGGFFFPLFVIALLIFWKHKTNIQRILNKQEPKIGKKVKN